MKDFSGIYTDFYSRSRTSPNQYRGQNYFAPKQYLGLVDFVKLIGDTETKTIIEIGCLFGVSTELFAQCFQKVIAIEPTLTPELEQLIQTFSNIELIQAFSQDIVGNFDDKSVDVVYVDGDHSYEGCFRDLTLYFPKIRPAGHIGVHDYDGVNHDLPPPDYNPHVKTAVDKFFGLGLGTILQDSTWVCRVPE